MKTSEIVVAGVVVLALGAGATGAVVLVKRQAAAEREQAARLDLERLKVQAAASTSGNSAPKVNAAGLDLSKVANTTNTIASVAKSVTSLVSGVKGFLSGW
jgi:uncharacterized protein YigA (DUF484 family)